MDVTASLFFSSNAANVLPATAQILCIFCNFSFAMNFIVVGKEHFFVEFNTYKSNLLNDELTENFKNNSKHSADNFYINNIYLEYIEYK